ncbi:hypothetical protein BD310DRAFT_928613 [Dichomitus squalens]|uniref:DUF6533 domain-containing protein n=1 Tax=Dichomitus squalens TaxID=114155 RepID=A0A4Q9PTR4_9APHY|nr:hypothetical protein BD310DRAFT_928613 [Dichomitus squalens]
MASSQTIQLITEYASATRDDYCFTAAAVMFTYDAILTTGDDVRCFWGRRVTGAAVLFWLNKYLTILLCFWSISGDLKICAISSQGTSAMFYVLFLPAAAFTGMRVYALSKSLLLSSAAFVLCTVPLGINLAVFHFGLTGENVPLLGCTIVTIVSRSCLIAGDFLALCVTLVTLYRRYAAIRHAGAPKATLSNVLLVDGDILVVLNVLHLAFTLISFDLPFLEDAGDLGQFVTIISPLLISRFLLHLQSANLRTIGRGSSQALMTSHDSSIIFERVVGPIGASITSDDYLDLEEDSDCGEAANDEGVEPK